MVSFIQRHRDSVLGVLNGLDRIRLRGTLRLLANVGGMSHYLWQVRVRLKDFKAYALSVTDRIRRAIEQVAEAADRPSIYLPGSSVSKEDQARDLAERDGIREGLIGVFSSVEPCFSYQIYRNRQTQQIELRGQAGKCKHYYHYCIHPQLGFLHVRLQTWFPFTVHVCINGREWLARQMDQAGIGYQRRDNCFVALADVAAAQGLLDQQLRVDWPALLNRLVDQANPAYGELFRDCPVPYYWSVDESEWASDVMFRSAAALTALYPHLLQHGMQILKSQDVLRFLGRRAPTRRCLQHEGIHNAFKGEVVTDLKGRPEGVRIKHRVNRNSVKMYNKQGSVLRVETTLNDARDMRVYRAREGDPQGPKRWRYLRKSVVDLPRRAEVCQAANERYLEALAAVEQTTPLKDLTEPLCRAIRWKGRRARAINPLNADDAALLEAVSRGEFLLHGFRNRDLRRHLHGPQTGSERETRRQSAAITRKLRLLRAHGLIRKVPHTHRYMLSPRGRAAITALLSARQADTKKLMGAA
jgi:hypothetical protein